MQPKPTFLAEANKKIEVLATRPAEKFPQLELCKAQFLPWGQLRLVYAGWGFDSLPRLIYQDNTQMQRQILANFDKEGIVVYQAFNPSTAEEAVRLGTFGKGFSLERMTWIKPSFGWMLYRSGYATKHNQERILKIKLSHEGFQTILSQGIHTSFEPGLFKSEIDWQLALRQGEVPYQWDPDRDLRLQRLERRALQVGIRGSVVRDYVNHWILGIEDVTELAHAIKEAIANKQRHLPSVPEERVYEVSHQIQQTLMQVVDLGDRFC